MTPTMNPDRWCRGIRAAVFAAACVLLTATGHVLMSDAAVPWWALVVAFGATGAAAWCLADRERGPFGVTVAAVAVQAALHSCFSLAQARAGAGVATHTSHATMGHDHTAHTAMGQQAMGQLPMVPDAMAQPPLGQELTAVVAMSGHDMGGLSPSGMLAAHLLAALLCGLWLAHGERGAFRILRALAAQLLAPLRLVLRLPAPPHRPRVRARREARARRLRRLLLAHVLVSRGPPPAAAVL